MNPILYALTNGATFVARGYSAQPNELTKLIVQGMEHEGFSFVHVRSPCAEFLNTYDYLDERVTELPADWDKGDLKSAIDLALTEEKVHLGAFYEEERPVFEQSAREFEAALQQFDLETYLKRFA
jgi:2-oxoglutarate ferredoxin oxidoreductase subunit beta